MEFGRKLEYVVKASKCWGASISGTIFGLISLASFVFLAIGVDSQKLTRTATITAVTSSAIACLLFFVAQYKVWEEERVARQKAEEELNAKADIQGTITIHQTTPQFFHADGIDKPATPVASFVFTADCANFGRKTCQLSKLVVNSKFHGKELRREILTLEGTIQPTAHGERFSRVFQFSFPNVPSDQADFFKMEVHLMDSLGVEYRSIKTQHLSFGQR